MAAPSTATAGGRVGLRLATKVPNEGTGWRDPGPSRPSGHAVCLVTKEPCARWGTTHDDGASLAAGHTARARQGGREACSGRLRNPASRRHAEGRAVRRRRRELRLQAAEMGRGGTRLVPGGAVFGKPVREPRARPRRGAQAHRLAVASRGQVAAMSRSGQSRAPRARTLAPPPRLGHNRPWPDMPEDSPSIANADDPRAGGGGP